LLVEEEALEAAHQEERVGAQLVLKEGRAVVDAVKLVEEVAK